jgi:translation initiation factor IF-1
MGKKGNEKYQYVSAGKDLLNSYWYVEAVYEAELEDGEEHYYKARAIGKTRIHLRFLNNFKVATLNARARIIRCWKEDETACEARGDVRITATLLGKKRLTRIVTEDAVFVGRLADATVSFGKVTLTKPTYADLGRTVGR